MSELTVFLAPATGAAEILDVLTDLSGADMLRPFHWMHGGDGGAGFRAVEVRDGRREPSELRRTIVARRFDRVRLCVLVTAPVPVPSAVEQELVGLLSANAGDAPVTRIRFLLTRGHGPAGPGPDDLARQGWHNLLVAPEQALGPATGRWVLPADTPPGDAAVLLGPSVAGIAGLWAGADGCCLDDLAIPADQTVRAARAFYRRVEAGDVERELRARVLTTRPQLPLPRPSDGPATLYLSDPGAACEAMAGHLWCKHPLGPPVGRSAAPVQMPPVGVTAVLRRLPAFLVATVRGNPYRWYGALLGSLRASVPGQDQARAVANLPPSHAQLVSGTGADGFPLGWVEIGRIADEIDGALPRLGAGPLPADPGPDPDLLWQDFAGGALTLADAGDRGGQEMPPARAGVTRGVAERVQSCVPGPPADFPVRGANVAAVTRIASVQAGDILGAEVLRRRLDALEKGVGLAEARAVAEVRADLGAWEAGQSSTYSYRVAAPVAVGLRAAEATLRSLLVELAAAARPPELTQAERDRQLVLGRWLLGVLGAGLGVALVTGLVMIFLVGASTGALVILGVALLVAVLGPVAGYGLGLRRTFRDMRRYRTLTATVEADQPRLRRALRDYRRLRDVYADYLAWSRAVAVVLADPFGPAVADAPPGGPVALDGLPPSVRVGHAVVDPEALIGAAAALRADLFVTNWLAGPWEANLNAAVRRLAGTPPPGVRPEPVLGSRAHPGGDPPVRAWSALLATEGPDRAVGDRTWAGVLSNLNRQRLGDWLPMRVREDASVPLAEFLAGVDRRGGVDDQAGAGQWFDAAHFTPLAQTQERARVGTSVWTGSRRGLSRVDVLVQLTDAFPVWDLRLGPDDDDPGPAPPGVGDGLVF